MQARVTFQTKGKRAVDGAGVSLVRVLGSETFDPYNPFLMLDAFDSTDPADYVAGFPMHPHRGIETVTFIARGTMVHRDHLGTEATVHDGEAQWLTAGSGAYHEEMPQPAPRMLGVQLWLNMPAADKMTAAPAYHGITTDEIPEIPFEGGTLRLVCGTYRTVRGHRGSYLPLDFYDIHLQPGAQLELDVPEGRSSMVFTLEGEARVCGTPVDAKTAAKLDGSTEVTLAATNEPAELLFFSSRAVDEPIAWWGPIVMNTEEELDTAWREINDGTFVKEAARYDA